MKKDKRVDAYIEETPPKARAVARRCSQRIVGLPASEAPADVTVARGLRVIAQNTSPATLRWARKMRSRVFRVDLLLCDDAAPGNRVERHRSSQRCQQSDGKPCY